MNKILAIALLLISNFCVANQNSSKCYENNLVSEEFAAKLGSASLYKFFIKNMKIDAKHHIDKRNLNVRVLIKSDNDNNFDKATEYIIPAYGEMRIDQLKFLPAGYTGNFTKTPIILTSCIIDKAVCIYVTGLFPSDLVVKAGCVTHKASAEQVKPDRRKSPGYPGSCYADTNRIASQTYFSVFGRAADCFQSVFEYMMFNRIGTDPLSNMKSYSQFSAGMRNVVIVALVIYAVLFGIKIVSSPERQKFKDFMSFFLKMALVSYFSVGFNTSSNVNFNGIKDVVVPTLIGQIGRLTYVATSATHRLVDNKKSYGLCEFNLAKYDHTRLVYASFDPIDCRLTNYLGSFIDLLNPTNIDPLNQVNAVFGNEILAKIILAIPILVWKVFIINLPITIALIIFIAAFISVVMHYVVCHILCIMFVLFLLYFAPIMVPLVLFQGARQYFDAWLRLLISFALQPIILIIIIAIIMSLSDNALFRGCTFERIEKNTPSLGRTIYTFKPDNSSRDGEHECKHSIGMIIKTPQIDSNFVRHYGSLFNLLITWCILYFAYFKLVGIAAQILNGVDIAFQGMDSTLLDPLRGLRNNYREYKENKR